MFERFTTAARDAVVRAQEEARAMRSGHIGTEHLLLALLAPEAGPARDVLTAAGLRREQVRADVERLRGQEVLGTEDAAALAAIGIDLEAVLGRIEASFGPDALRPPEPAPRRGLLRRRPRSRHIPFTPGAKKALELALREALHLEHRHIGSEHLLLGLLREGRGPGARVIAASGVDLDDLRRATLARADEAA